MIERDDGATASDAHHNIAIHNNAQMSSMDLQHIQRNVMHRN